MYAPHRNEDLSSVPRTMIKAEHDGVLVISMLGVGVGDGSLDLLTMHVSCLVNSKLVRDPVSAVR